MLYWASLILSLLLFRLLSQLPSICALIASGLFFTLAILLSCVICQLLFWPLKLSPGPATNDLSRLVVFWYSAVNNPG